MGDSNKLEEIDERLQTSETTETFTLGASGLTLRYAHVCGRGFYPEAPEKKNQDALKVLPAFGGDEQQLLLGVFDGHGEDGHHLSHFVRSLPHRSIA